MHHFCKTSSVQVLTKDGLESIGEIIETLATAEGLAAHARSVSVRLQGAQKGRTIPAAEGNNCFFPVGPSHFSYAFFRRRIMQEPAMMVTVCAPAPGYMP